MFDESVGGYPMEIYSLQFNPSVVNNSDQDAALEFPSAEPFVEHPSNASNHLTRSLNSWPSIIRD